MANKGDFKAIMKSAQAQGWTITRSRNNHLRWHSPSGQVVFSAATPSDHRAIRNHVTMMRRAGYVAQ